LQLQSAAKVLSIHSLLRLVGVLRVVMRVQEKNTTTTLKLNPIFKNPTPPRNLMEE
jgi:hypothetical protein